MDPARRPPDATVEHLRAYLDELHAKVASYGGGDRPSSPPAALLREEREVEAILAARSADTAVTPPGLASTIIDWKKLALDNQAIARRFAAERDADRAAFKEAIAQRDGDVAHHRDEAERLAGRVRDLEASVALLDREGRKVVKEREEATAEIDRLKESLATACKMIGPPTDEQNDAMLDAEAEVTRLRAQLDTETSSLAALASGHYEARKEAERALEDAQIACSEAGAGVGLLPARIRELGADLRSERATVERLRSHRDSAIDNLRGLIGEEAHARNPDDLTFHTFEVCQLVKRMKPVVEAAVALQRQGAIPFDRYGRPLILALEVFTAGSR